MAFTEKDDFVFKHSDQADTPVFGTTALLKAALDSQAVEIRTYINDVLLVELEASGASAKIGALVGSVASNLQAFIDAVELAGSGTLPPASTITDYHLSATIKQSNLKRKLRMGVTL